MNVSLQTKLLVLILTLLSSVILLLSGTFAYFESKETEQEVGQLALQVATTVSLIPGIREAFHTEDPAKIIQPMTIQMKEQVGAEFIVVGNKDSIRYSHTQQEKIGKRMVGGDNDRALINGEYYTSKAVGSMGPSLRGKAPIFDDNGKIIGLVSVGFLEEDIHTLFIHKLRTYGIVSILVLVAGAVGAVLLAKNIRRDTHGLEPKEIAALYRERNAILLSIKEGIIAVDEKGLITMMNNSARKLLGVSGRKTQVPVQEVIPNTEMYDIQRNDIYENDQEMLLNGKVVIVNRTPIMDKNGIVGAVASFREKTEVTEMINTLSEVRQYSEDLRAQTHEFTNKLYAISGLLQLEEYEEAIDLIHSEADVHGSQNRIVFEQIHDRKVQAILLGKIGKASEYKVTFSIDPTSFLKPLPKRVAMSDLITILGNIMDNAFDAVAHEETRTVTFFTTDIGKDIVFEVADTGAGIPDGVDVFQRGVSSKQGKNRGVGLALVKETVTRLGGTIEVHVPKSGGTVFTVFIPKEEKRGEEG
ncbi:ATPase [Bacillus sp. Leaf406]|nr:ATPase [Bacillus sp. Leaf406]